MMSRSSTSNSSSPGSLPPKVSDSAEVTPPRSLDLRGFRPWGLVCCIALLLAFEVFVARQPWLWAWTPRSQSGIVDVLESRVIEPAPQPTIVVLGSSRVRDAVLPRHLESELDLPTGSVLNLGLNAGTPFDALKLYERNRDKLRQAKLLIVGIDDWYCNAGMGPNDRDRRFADLSDRVTGFHTEDRVRLTVGWCWKTYDARSPLKQFFKVVLGDRPAPLPLTEDGRVQWRRKELTVGPQQVDVMPDVNMLYQRYRATDARLNKLKDLIDMAEADHLQVVVIQVPARDAYMDVVLTDHHDAYEHYRQQVETIDAPKLLYERGRELNIPEDHFYDYGHLTLNGATRFTSHLADVLDSEMTAWRRDAPRNGLDKVALEY